MTKRWEMMLFGMAFLAACTAGKHRSDVDDAAASLNSRTTIANMATSSAMYANYETCWGQHLLNISSTTAFKSYNSSTGYYSVQVYTNGARDIRYENSSGNALAVMGTGPTFANAGIGGQVSAVRVLFTDAFGTRNVTRRTASPNTISGSLATGISYSSGTTDGTLVSPTLSWLPYTGMISGSGIDLRFSTNIGTGTATDLAATATIMVVPTFTSSKLNYNFSVTDIQAAPAARMDPMAALGYGNE